MAERRGHLSWTEGHRSQASGEMWTVTDSLAKEGLVLWMGRPRELEAFRNHLDLPGELADSG